MLHVETWHPNDRQGGVHLRHIDSSPLPVRESTCRRREEQPARRDDSIASPPPGCAVSCQHPSSSSSLSSGSGFWPKLDLYSRVKVRKCLVGPVLRTGGISLTFSSGCGHTGKRLTTSSRSACGPTTGKKRDRIIIYVHPLLFFRRPVVNDQRPREGIPLSST